MIAESVLDDTPYPGLPVPVWVLVDAVRLVVVDVIVGSVVVVPLQS